MRDFRSPFSTREARVALLAGVGAVAILAILVAAFDVSPAWFFALAVGVGLVTAGLAARRTVSATVGDDTPIAGAVGGSAPVRRGASVRHPEWGLTSAVSEEEGLGRLRERLHAVQVEFGEVHERLERAEHEGLELARQSSESSRGIRREVRRAMRRNHAEQEWLGSELKNLSEQRTALETMLAGRPADPHGATPPKWFPVAPHVRRRAEGERTRVEGLQDRVRELEAELERVRRGQSED